MTVARKFATPAIFGVVLALVTGCGSPNELSAATDTVTVTNCGEEVSFEQPLERLFVNDGGMIAIALAAGAREQMVAVSSMARDVDVLRLEFGSQVDGLNEVAPAQPTLENIVGAKPQVLYAGYNYGMGEERGITPEILAGHGIAVYQLSEACRQVEGQSVRGTMDPWVALDTDLRNIGAITGNAAQGTQAADDIAARLER
ncbi:iron transporter, partial [Mycolicibacterium pulveris]